MFLEILRCDYVFSCCFGHEFLLTEALVLAAAFCLAMALTSSHAALALWEGFRFERSVVHLRGHPGPCLSLVFQGGCFVLCEVRRWHITLHGCCLHRSLPLLEKLLRSQEVVVVRNPSSFETFFR